MHTEHHIDSFDLNSFFALHDLNSDGSWDEPEIQAVYGLHHHSVKGKMPADHVDSRADVVVKKVLDKLDTNKDGKSDRQVGRDIEGRREWLCCVYISWSTRASTGVKRVGWSDYSGME
jgi:hypothetical protein